MTDETRRKETESRYRHGSLAVRSNVIRGLEA